MDDINEILAKLLIELKNNYNATGVKLEFETEVITFDEALFLKKVVKNAGLDFVVKIGGCGAARDLYEAKTLDADYIIAPMVETSYALEKFVCAAKSVYSADEYSKIKSFINIETKQGFLSLDEIFKSEYFSFVSGIVIGRSDLTASFGLDLENVNSDTILEYISHAALLAKQYDKELVVGGNVSAASIPFFKKVADIYLTKFETRKIIFNTNVLNNNKMTEEAILKAIEFELLCLENIKNPDRERIAVLKKRFDAKY